MSCSQHTFYAQDSRTLQEVIAQESVDLVVTSPPYPMIQMWDELFFSLNPEIKPILARDPMYAFETMHKELDKVWLGLAAILKEGAFLIINIGDATRTLQNNFQLFSNHARIIQKCLSLGLQNLPNILWRKPTNAPNKFMGSGMLPSGAYVTLEHEHILIFRKGNKANFQEEKRQIRRESSYFWEERNIWFSDVWDDVMGSKQMLKNKDVRSRSAAYPFELAYRLINMYSCKGDTILDPFWGTGTTSLAALSSERNSIGIELEPVFINTFLQSVAQDLDTLNQYTKQRIQRHIDFVTKRKEIGKEIKHFNSSMNFAVMTTQEQDLVLKEIASLETKESSMQATYSCIKQREG
ncbi:MAG: site-specific DNA-methyltransferase [Spirochaetota bacterium]